MASTSIQSPTIIDTAKCTHAFPNFTSRDAVWWTAEFRPPTLPKHCFQLGIYPTNSWDDFKKDIFCCLWISPFDDDEDDEKHWELAVQYRVSILDRKGVKHYTKDVIWNYTTNSKLGRDHSIIRLIPRAYLLDPANGLLPGDKLTIYCEVDILSSKIPQITNVSLQPANKLEDSIQTDFESLLENGKLSDVLLVVGKKEFHAHKSILAARSKVFGAMFENKETRESIENRVEIIDVDVEVFEELLMYIYTGKISTTDKNALDLFVAADKYQLDHLKLVCEQTLSTSLTIESVVSTFMVADMHQAGDLKSECIDYITEHSVKVMATDGWAQFVKANRFELLHQLFEAIATKKTSGNNVTTKRKRKREQN